MKTKNLAISAAILIKNSERHLKDVLSALSCLDEILIIDTGSKDHSLSIAANFPNTKVLAHDFTNFGHLRNFAASQAKHDWILCIDSDEVLSSKAQNELIALQLDDRFCYSFPFHNYFRGKWIKSCSWYPDRHTRLYNKKFCSFSEKQVHESLQTTSTQTFFLQGPIDHYSYHNISDFLIKMERYSELFAKEYAGKKQASIFTALVHAKFTFFKSYFIKKGFMDGYEGFLISLYQSLTALFKYLKLREKNQDLSKKP